MNDVPALPSGPLAAASLSLVQATASAPIALPVNGEYLHQRLPHNEHDYVDAGHFAWADAADDYARLLIDWWNGGYERV